MFAFTIFEDISHFLLKVQNRYAVDFTFAFATPSSNESNGNLGPHRLNWMARRLTITSDTKLFEFLN